MRLIFFSARRLAADGEFEAARVSFKEVGALWFAGRAQREVLLVFHMDRSKG